MPTWTKVKVPCPMSSVTSLNQGGHPSIPHPEASMYPSNSAGTRQPHRQVDAGASEMHLVQLGKLRHGEGEAHRDLLGFLAHLPQALQSVRPGPLWTPALPYDEPIDWRRLGGQRGGAAAANVTALGPLLPAQCEGLCGEGTAVVDQNPSEEKPGAPPKWSPPVSVPKVQESLLPSHGGSPSSRTSGLCPWQVPSGMGGGTL